MDEALRDSNSFTFVPSLLLAVVCGIETPQLVWTVQKFLNALEDLKFREVLRNGNDL